MNSAPWAGTGVADAGVVDAAARSGAFMVGPLPRQGRQTLGDDLAEYPQNFLPPRCRQAHPTWVQWFRDLSAPDPFFVLPVVIGAASFVQQKLMPQQVDMAQQKMMLYFMPALFTVMMLFLPSGLGIYMLTNSILGIVQQQAVERFAPRTPGIEVREKDGAGDKTATGKKDQQRKLSGTLPAKLKGGS